MSRSFLFAVLFIGGGIGLIMKRKWARIVGIVACFAAFIICGWIAAFLLKGSSVNAQQIPLLFCVVFAAISGFGFVFLLRNKGNSNEAG